MEKKIIFQKCNFYFLFYIIVDFINLLLEYYLHPTTDILEELKGESLNDYILPFQLFKLLHMYTLSDFIAIIPYFIRKIQLKKRKILMKLKRMKMKKFQMIMLLFIMIIIYYYLLKKIKLL